MEWIDRGGGSSVRDAWPVRRSAPPPAAVAISGGAPHHIHYIYI